MEELEQQSSDTLCRIIKALEIQSEGSAEDLDFNFATNATKSTLAKQISNLFKEIGKLKKSESKVAETKGYALRSKTKLKETVVELGIDIPRMKLHEKTVRFVGRRIADTSRLANCNMDTPKISK